MFDSLPFGLTYAIFFAGAMVRANTTYWLGRAARRGGESTGASRMLAAPLVRRAETVLARFGAPVVTLSFLTVGVQTAVNAAAGVLRMPLWRYEIAVVLGSLVWALIYTTVGFAVVEAWVGHAPWWFWLVVSAAVLAVVLSTRMLRRRIERASPYPEPAQTADLP